ncbi:phosphate ABC transporter permease subunit PstC [Apibacter sp. HY039]|uniref:phosphate ABC transporter permease subunit PstC n=1 Tax=Apibacter sp. HY039 TaxID=2501476 RepID=UPI000FEB6460|nr:phosphate ABC transporter permease subunit PstC [Apibacter sp. HY039]
MKDRLFKIVLFLASFLILLLTAGIVYALISQSLRTFSEIGFFKFLTSDSWNPKTDKYGALSFISGTLMTSVLALAFCVLFSLPVALFNGEYFRGKKISTVVSSIVDLLAGIPSIVYGLWGFYVVCPVLVDLGVSDTGFGVLLASIVLAIMIIPYASSLSAEFISMVPNELKEAAYSLGATRLEVVTRISLPAAGSGILTSYILALGRALGETMAVTMLIGNTNAIPTGITGTGNTMASIIANQFGEADGLKLSSLIAIGLLLFLITAVINFIAKYSMKLINKA